MSDQLALDLRTPPTWGGARDGAGRKKTGRRSDPLHRSRPTFSRHQPQHVVLRTVKGLPRLRYEAVYIALRRVMGKLLAKADFRVVHLSIQKNHLHLLVEAEHKEALSHGMRAFAITAARAINAALGRRGKVFAHRYHATAISSPRQARHALAYVLNNWRRHDEDERSERAQLALIDPYSTAIHFAGWAEVDRFDVPAGFTPLPVARASTWLLNVGWERHGKIRVREVPGPLRATAGYGNKSGDGVWEKK